MKKYIHFLIVPALIIAILYGFHKINVSSYEKAKRIQAETINHPENLPTPEHAAATAFGFSNLKADIYWLRAIQYIGSNAISSEYKKYLSAMLQIITELNPYFKKPYLTGMLLLPSYNERYEDKSTAEQDENIQQGILLGLKGIKNFCNTGKVEKIIKESDLEKIMTDPSFANPCESYEIPYYLAFIYYFYLKDSKSAANYYKVASANTDSLTGAKVMATIMQGKGGEREKAFFSFISLATTLEDDDQVCQAFAEELYGLGAQTFYNNVELSGELVSQVEVLRNQVFPPISEQEDEEDYLGDTQCQNYLQKSIRELNLEYLSRANAQYQANTGENAPTPEVLQEAGYIDFIPTDFQQYESYGIIYFYNDEINNFDYEMGDY